MFVKFPRCCTWFSVHVAVRREREKNCGEKLFFCSLAPFSKMFFSFNVNIFKGIFWKLSETNNLALGNSFDQLKQYIGFYSCESVN